MAVPGRPTGVGDGGSGGDEDEEAADDVVDQPLLPQLPELGQGRGIETGRRRHHEDVVQPAMDSEARDEGDDDSPDGSKVSSSTEAALLQSFTGADQIADRYPQYKDQIVSATTDRFLSGSNWAYIAAVVATVFGAVLVATRFPGKAGEASLVASYEQADAKASE
jgi:hypothetical protein